MFLYVGIMVAFLGVSMVKFKTKKDRRVTLVLCLLVLLVLMAFKGATVGNDTPSYIRIYNNFKLENVWYNPEHRFEIGYQILCKLVIIFFDHHQFVFIFSAIICCFCLYKGLKSNSENIGFSLFLFVALRIFYFYLSGIRQAVAMSIIFMSYNQIKNKQYFKFVILVLIASTFHFFALTFLIAIPLSFMKFNVKNVCVIL
ncbi:MAG: EpsG family protein [Clostridia bacterium]|nr:EpsG family protein [Clostridia bacterium]